MKITEAPMSDLVGTIASNRVSVESRMLARAELDRRFPVPAPAAETPTKADWFTSLKPGDAVEWSRDGKTDWKPGKVHHWWGLCTEVMDVDIGAEDTVGASRAQVREPAAEAPACSMCLSTTECKMGCPGEDADEAPDAGPNADLNEIAKACGSPGDMDAPAWLHEVLCTLASYEAGAKSMRETIAAKDAGIAHLHSIIERWEDDHREDVAAKDAEIAEVTAALRDALGIEREEVARLFRETNDLRAALETERAKREDPCATWDRIHAALGASAHEPCYKAAERVVRERDEARAEMRALDGLRKFKNSTAYAENCARLHRMLDNVLCALGIVSESDDYSDDGQAILAAIEALKAKASQQWCEAGNVIIRDEVLETLCREAREAKRALAIARALGFEGPPLADLNQATIATVSKALGFNGPVPVESLVEAVERLKSRALVIPAEVLKIHPLPWNADEDRVRDCRRSTIAYAYTDGSVAEDRAVAAAIVSAANGGAS